VSCWTDRDVVSCAAARDGKNHPIGGDFSLEGSSVPTGRSPAATWSVAILVLPIKIGKTK